MGTNDLHNAAKDKDDKPLADVKAVLARPNGKELAMEQNEVSEDNVHTHTLSFFCSFLFSFLYFFRN